jgi:hypothetical protein
VLFVVVLVWIAGTNSSGVLLGIGVLLAALSLFLWRWNRQVMRSVLRDLRPPE